MGKNSVMGEHREGGSGSEDSMEAGHALPPIKPSNPHQTGFGGKTLTYAPHPKKAPTTNKPFVLDSSKMGFLKSDLSHGSLNKKVVSNYTYHLFSSLNQRKTLMKI